MNRQIVFRYSGRPETLAGQDLLRILPNRFVDAVGAFTFLDHFPERMMHPKEPGPPDGSFAHPHRGIATFTYLLEGMMEHYDSMGNHGIVKSGGIQWMKAGNGVVHDEAMPSEFQRKGGALHGLQFWINLPADNKAESPEYLPVHAEDVPEILLSEKRGKIRVLIGEYEQEVSAVPAYTHQYLFHLVLEAGASYARKEDKMENAAYLTNGEARIDGQNVKGPELLIFDRGVGAVEIENIGDTPLNIMLFGGETYTEPIVAQGPFVMNTREEIYKAYLDYRKGQYGTINYRDYKE
jgi:redox-sensitive bicupin YhaK (pirin superfamily)